MRLSSLSLGFVFSLVGVSSGYAQKEASDSPAVCQLAQRGKVMTGKPSAPLQAAFLKQLPGYLLSIERGLSMTLKKKGGVDSYHTNDPARPFECGFWWLDGANLVIKTFTMKGKPSPQKNIRLKAELQDEVILIDGQLQSEDKAWEWKVAEQ